MKRKYKKIVDQILDRDSKKYNSNSKTYRKNKRAFLNDLILRFAEECYSKGYIDCENGISDKTGN